MNQSYPSNLPLKCEDTLQAHLHQVKTGQDPGFFMHPSLQKHHHHQSGSSLYTDIITCNATVALQDAYEKTTKQKKQSSTEHEPKKNKKEHKLMTKADSGMELYF